MSAIGQPERATQDRAIALFRDEPGGLWVVFPFGPNQMEPGMSSATRPILPARETVGGPPPSTREVAGEVTGEVTGQVRRLLLVCQGAMTRKELQQKLLLKGEENFRKLYLGPAIEAGYVEMTIPGKPNSRLQKYRLTAKGAAVLSSGGQRQSRS